MSTHSGSLLRILIHVLLVHQVRAKYRVAPMQQHRAPRIIKTEGYYGKVLAAPGQSILAGCSTSPRCVPALRDARAAGAAVDVAALLLHLRGSNLLKVLLSRLLCGCRLSLLGVWNLLLGIRPPPWRPGTL